MAFELAQVVAELGEAVGTVGEVEAGEDGVMDLPCRPAILLQEGVLEVGTEDMMAVLDAVDDGGELAVHPAVHAGAKDLGDLIGRRPPQAEFADTFEQLVDREVALEDEVAAILDLGDRVKA